MKKIDVDYLKHRLHYDDIEEHLHEGVFKLFWRKYPYRHQEFRVIPKDKSAPCISLLFDLSAGKQTLIQTGFHEFHTHFESRSEEKDIEESLEFVSNLIAGDIGLMVTVNSRGKYRGGSIRKLSEMLEPQKNQKLYVFNAGKGNQK
jgi:hypothetical protein